MRACRFLTGVFCIAVLLLGACVTASTERFYVLEPISKPTATSPLPGDNLVIGIGKIAIPVYLDRPQIMTKVHGNELMLDEHSLWAEPLQEAIPRVIALNLQALTGAEVKIDPWRRARQVTYRLSAQLGRLDGMLGGEAVLEVRWGLEDTRTQGSPVMRDSHLVTTVNTGDYRALADAYSRLIAAFSSEVAGEVARFSR
jgi:uncharacterized protein